MIITLFAAVGVIAIVVVIWTIGYINGHVAGDTHGYNRRIRDEKVRKCEEKTG